MYKIKNKIILTTTALLLSLNTIAKPVNTIQNISSLADAVQHTNKHTLVLLDIDNTLATAKQTLGTDQWFEYMIHKYQQEQKDSPGQNSAIFKAVDKWIQVQYHTELKPIENSTVASFKDLQNKSQYVIALTARPSMLSKLTNQQLKTIGLDFSLNNKHLKNIVINKQQGVQYIDGIITSSHQNKGETLKEFLKQSDINTANIKQIIFIDDKLKNIQALSTATQDLNLDYIGFKYDGSQEKIAKFKPEIADKQLNIFEKCKKLVSDKTAKLLSNFRSCEEV